MGPEYEFDIHKDTVESDFKGFIHGDYLFTIDEKGTIGCYYLKFPLWARFKWFLVRIKYWIMSFFRNS